VQLACREALSANAVPAARAALLHLLKILQQQQQQQDPTAAANAATTTTNDSSSSAGSSNSSSCEVSEGWVVRALVKLDVDELERQAELVRQHKSAEGSNSHTTAPALALQEQQQQQAAESAAADDQPGGSSAAAAASLAAATAAAAGCAVQLSEVLSGVVQRLRVLGVEVFSGEKEAEGGS